jgi:hypothetical protein
MTPREDESTVNFGADVDASSSGSVAWNSRSGPIVLVLWWSITSERGSTPVL